MGEYQGTPLVWRAVLKEEENNSISSVANYTAFAEFSGSYYFLLDTYIPNIFNCSFENNYTRSGSYPRLDEYGNTVNVNDYAVSNIREYRIGVNVYRGSSSSGSDRIPALVTGQTEPENFITKFNLDSSPIYSMIEGRTLSDLYSRMAKDLVGSEVKFDIDVEYGIEEIAAINPDTTVDKLWLLSYFEASFITKAPQTTAADYSGARNWNASYWLRSPVSSYTDWGTLVSSDGTLSDSDDYNAFCVRPAFKISF